MSDRLTHLDAKALEAHELQVLLCAGDPEGTRAAPAWRRVNAAG